MSLTLQQRFSLDTPVSKRHPLTLSIHGYGWPLKGCGITDQREAVDFSLEGDALRVRCPFAMCREANEASTSPCGHIQSLLVSLEHKLPPGPLTLKRWDGSPYSTPRPAWIRALDRVASLAETTSQEDRPATTMRALYVLDLERSINRGRCAILVMTQRGVDGHWGAPTEGALYASSPFLQNSDRALLDVLTRSDRTEAGSGWSFLPIGQELTLPLLIQREVFQRLCETGRFVWRLSARERELHKLRWDDRTWRLRLDFSRRTAAGMPLAADASPEELAGGHWSITGALHPPPGPTDEGAAASPEDDTLLSVAEPGADGPPTPTDGPWSEAPTPLSEPVLLLATGVVVFTDRIAAYTPKEGFGWIGELRREGEIRVPLADTPALARRLQELGSSSWLELPKELAYGELAASVRGCLRIRAAKPRDRELIADLLFDYDGLRPEGGAAPVDHERRLVVRRDLSAEQSLRQTLHRLDVGIVGSNVVTFPPGELPRVVGELTAAGWLVEAEGQPLRRAGGLSIQVKSSVDWFDVEAAFDFDGESVPLPRVLEALRRGDRYVTLGDGAHGMLPDEWLAKYGGLAGLGAAEGDALRFVPSQALLLDALLAEQQQATVDRPFAAVRRRLRAFSGIAPAEPPATFAGELRPYQREGLGWLRFLQEFKLGGCLADDMGLGKTIQVLALFEQRRRRRLKAGETRRPSLIVVPRSLMFNWLEEAGRFTPRLRTLDYSGLDRKSVREQFDQHDLIVTTYGIVRRDIEWLREQHFDYVVLDEAQAIKNSLTNATKACRLLRSDHRLALTGTPVENHLGELWSIFEFLNPGLLGRSQAFDALARDARTPEGQDGLRLLARALRPYVLRRTKQEVLKDLPEKSEQTLYCELGPEQRRLYNELRDYYRQSLKQRVAEEGLEKSKIHVLEALLRLRQVACHPKLVQSNHRAPSAKLEALLERLEELVAEGHKALIFSQFTQLLALVRKRLDRQKIVYEYLDGQTRDRQARVKRFQEDQDCSAFLISLRAGGQGLNLTAADYVFILDPWWNPAVEAQAVDRAHRLGQQRQVFAYRLICKDTVEEKILELQKHKRQLADAIISADNSLIRQLSAEDLQLLLS